MLRTARTENRSAAAPFSFNERDVLPRRKIPRAKCFPAFPSHAAAHPERKASVALVNAALVVEKMPLVAGASADIAV